MDLETTIAAYLTLASFAATGLMMKFLMTMPEVKDTWSKIPDLIESLQELTRVYARRRDVMHNAAFAGLCITLLNELSWVYFQRWSDWAPVIDAVVASLHITSH